MRPHFVLVGLLLLLGVVMLWFQRTERFSVMKMSVSDRETTLLRQAREFHTHLLTYHAADPRVQRLLSTWNGTIVSTDKFPSRSIRGSFAKESGRLKLRVNDDQLSEAQLRGVLLHELAHTTGIDHDEAWRDCFVFFANIATEHLGWDVNLSQPHNCANYGICDLRCRLCGFEHQKTHVVTRGQRMEDKWSRRLATPSPYHRTLLID